MFKLNMMQQKEDLTESSFFYMAHTINTNSVILLEQIRSRQHRPSFKKIRKSITYKSTVSTFPALMTCSPEM